MYRQNQEVKNKSGYVLQIVQFKVDLTSNIAMVKDKLGEIYKLLI